MQQSRSGFVHSVKVPHLYKASSKIVKKILEDGGGLKELLYTNVRANLKSAYALITKTIERNSDLDYVIKKSKILSENPKLDPWLAKVIIAELLFGKRKLEAECKPIQTVRSYREVLELAIGQCAVQSRERKPVEKKPRYVRVNNLRKTCDEVIKAFRYEEWELIPLPDNYTDFLDAVKNLTESQFIRDFHLKNVLVFPPRTEFFRHELYQDGTIILQDKASCLPPFLLNPPQRSTVLDMCAAPGMKTTMLAALMRGKGKVYAIEINSRRFQTLQKMINLVGCENVTATEEDALQLSENSHPWCKEVEYILVDPTCSGTGMTERASLFTFDKSNCERLRKITAFQRKLLIYALTEFRAARRVVYSTCSIQEEENEAVISSVLSSFPSPSPWTVVHALPEWSSRGSDKYEFGINCLTASPSIDLTTGFFIAVLERVEGIELNYDEERAKCELESSKNKSDGEMNANSYSSTATSQCVGNVHTDKYGYENTSNRSKKKGKAMKEDFSGGGDIAKEEKDNFESASLRKGNKETWVQTDGKEMKKEQCLNDTLLVESSDVVKHSKKKKKKSRDIDKEWGDDLNHTPQFEELPQHKEKEKTKRKKSLKEDEDAPSSTEGEWRKKKKKKIKLEQ